MFQAVSESDYKTDINYCRLFQVRLLNKSAGYSLQLTCFTFTGMLHISTGVGKENKHQQKFRVVDNSCANKSFLDINSLDNSY